MTDLDVNTRPCEVQDPRGRFFPSSCVGDSEF
jgi:hypothetical protein